MYTTLTVGESSCRSTKSTKTWASNFQQWTEVVSSHDYANAWKLKRENNNNGVSANHFTEENKKNTLSILNCIMNGSQRETKKRLPNHVFTYPQCG